jgi:hypothetical protein
LAAIYEDPEVFRISIALPTAIAAIAMRGRTHALWTSEDRFCHPCCDWAKRSWRCKAEKQKRRHDRYRNPSRRRGWDHKTFEVQRWTFAALRSDGAQVWCNGAHVHASHDVPKFKPVRCELQDAMACSGATKSNW